LMESMSNNLNMGVFYSRAALFAIRKPRQSYYAPCAYASRIPSYWVAMQERGLRLRQKAETRPLRRALFL
jgi:hypothetical protein